MPDRPVSSETLAGRTWDGETCQSCGGEVAASCPTWWYADDALWREVTGEEEGIRCIPCFTREAQEEGICVKWAPVVDARFDGGQWVEEAAPSPRGCDSCGADGPTFSPDHSAHFCPRCFARENPPREEAVEAPCFNCGGDRVNPDDPKTPCPACSPRPSEEAAEALVDAERGPNGGIVVPVAPCGRISDEWCYPLESCCRRGGPVEKIEMEPISAARPSSPVREIIVALENAYHPQNPTPEHPADLVERMFGRGTASQGAGAE